LGDISGKPDCGRAYFLSVEIEVSEDIAEEDGEFAATANIVRKVYPSGEI